MLVMSVWDQVLDKVNVTVIVMLMIVKNHLYAVDLEDQISAVFVTDQVSPKTNAIVQVLTH